MKTPQQIAFNRESQLAAALICQGVTALSKANHAQPGLYAQAFFGLSIGLERMGKLIIIADHAIKNGGAFLSDTQLRKIGHDISSLLPQCESIATTLPVTGAYAARPSDSINTGIEEVLTAFAKSLRYYNLTFLSGSAGNQQDPIALWWARVAIPICERHYKPKQRAKDEFNAANIERILGARSMVLHTGEDGTPMNDLATLSNRSGATRIVQKFGRMYSLQTVRWLAEIIDSLCRKGAYEQHILPLIGISEPFARFLNEDRDLRDWGKWSF